MRDRKDRFQIGAFWLDQHDNGIWYVCWLDRAERQRRRRSLRTRDVEEAKRRLAKHEALNRIRQNEPAAQTPVNEIIGLYARRHIPTTASPESNRFHLLACVEPIGDLTVAEFRPPVQRRIFNAMLADGVKASTVRRRLSAVRAALRWACKDQGMIDNIPEFITIQVDDQRRRDLTIDELQALWRADMPEHTRAFILLSMATISRKAAVLQLTRFQCDLDRDLIDMNPPGRRRTKKGRAVLPMVPSVRHLVEASEGPLVAYKGRAVRDIKHSFAAAVESAGLVDVVPKDLRTTMATLLHAAGVPLQQIDDAQGHTDPRSTARNHYIQVRPEYLQDWAMATDAIIQKVTGQGVFGETLARRVTTSCVQTAYKAGSKASEIWSE